MDIDSELLKRFENNLDPAHPERSIVPARILGYGEISTIFEIDFESMRGLACKRMAIFRTMQEVESYERLYNGYNKVLSEEVGIGVPEYGLSTFVTERGNVSAYAVQRMLPPKSIGNRALASMDAETIRAFFLLVLDNLMKVWEFNRANPDRAIGIDGQISNWAIVGFDPSMPKICPDTRLLYFDTSTPLMKAKGVEQLDPELFMRSAPSFLLWLIRWLFLKGVMTRYYDARLVAIDIIANFYKEQRPELVPDLVDAANRFFADTGAWLGLKPLSQKEIAAYYKEDSTIWVVFLAFRRFDRWLHRYVLRKQYLSILPGKIKR